MHATLRTQDRGYSKIVLINRMSSTKSSFNESFSPVALPESPANSTPQRNLTGLPRVARDISADIYNNIQQWNLLHIKGASIVKEIALLKADNRIIYPDGLELYSESLSEVVNAMKLITENLETCAQQLKSLIKLHKTVVPMFISWSIEKMSTISYNIYCAYRQEYQLKQFIVDNMPHISGKDKIMFYAASWCCQPYITDDVHIYLESLLTETGHRSKT